MKFRIALALVAIVLAATIPAAAFSAGIPIFWSRALGILACWTPLSLAVAGRPRHPRQFALPWLMAMATATLVAFAIHRALG